MNRLLMRHTTDAIPGESDEESVHCLPLTEREREILALVAVGNSNKLIACKLFISERTVKGHLTNIMTKLQASDRTHAVVTALRMRWLDI